MWGRSRSWEPGNWSAPTGQLRVLLEDPDGAVLSAAESFLVREGFDVAVCGGPEQMGRHICPLMADGHCELSAGADVIYTSLAWHNPESREVLKALRARHPGTPVVVEIPYPAVARFQDVLESCHLVHTPVGRTAMVKAIRAALEQGVPEPAASLS
jgi:DNA-binding NtrC family response regulator